MRPSEKMNCDIIESYVQRVNNDEEKVVMQSYEIKEKVANKKRKKESKTEL